MSNNFIRHNLFWITPITFILLTIILSGFYILNSKISTPEDKVYLYILPNTTKAELVKQIKNQDIVFNSFVFDLYSKVYRFNTPKTGMYILGNGMKINKVIKKLSRKQQDPIRLVIGKSRTKEDFANKISQELSFSSKELLDKLNNNKYLKQFGIDSLNSLSIVIPNTYEVYWDISVEGFLSRMYKESNKFWDKRNIENHPLDKREIIILASIVEEETNKNDEKKRVAGVYINRLEKNMLLQADPTVKFAIGDFEIKRILGVMLNIDSPYNTYRNIGLPIGAICIPSISSIDAVVNYEKHDYFYFCAKEDFSGYHAFAKTYDEHLINARKYHNALNKNG